VERIRWSRRLSVRFALLTAGLVAATGAVLGAAGLRAHRRHVEAEALRSAALLSETIRASTRSNMLEDRRADVYAVMRGVAAQEGIESVRIFNKEGRVTFSTRRGETGRSVDTRAESCYACHAADRPIARPALTSRGRVFRSTDGHRVLAMVTPIYNEPNCSTASCHAHPARQQVLGVVDVGLSLQEVDAAMDGFQRRVALGGALGIAVLATLVGGAAARRVVKPMADLVEATRSVAQGDLSRTLPVRQQDEVGALAASFNDMTEALRQALAQRQELLDSLEHKVEERTADLKGAQTALVRSEKLASLGQMAASIAHEINNPLAGIVTYAKLLLREIEEGGLETSRQERVLKSLRLVEREGRRCTTIVRNLLDFARQRPLTIAEVDLRAALDEALALVAHQFALKGVALDRTFEDLPPVRGDFGQLRQCFVNLALNACDATPAGGSLAVAARPADEGRIVEVDFTDTGSGIAPEHLTRVFDPFFTTKEKGTGLGLSVVYGIVQRHGGEVTVDSGPERGTRVSLRLPVAGPDAAAA
jgi:two-component system, NtrC family, sensor kinase